MIQESEELSWEVAGSGSEEMTPSWLTSASRLAISSGVLGCSVFWAVGSEVAAGSWAAAPSCPSWQNGSAS